MNINYYYRNKKTGFSIGVVFDTIVNEIGINNQVIRTFLPYPNATIPSILKNGWFAKNEEKNNYINHITGDVHYLLWFLRRRKTIVTVHDIMYYHYLKGIKKKIWKLLYITPLKRAAHVTFISDFAYKQVSEVINLDMKKVHIIPNPVDSSFTYSPKEFNVKKPIILHIGTLERKNLERTIEALDGIDCHLRIIGELKEQTIDLLKRHHIEYSNGINLTHEEIVTEYRNADVINFPSLFEGFGMPIIEGQATGRIVITSNLSPMKEVAGNGAILINPYSAEDIRNAYLSVIQNESIREQLINEGLKNIENYKVRKVVQQYTDLYKEIYENID
ncbi:glycosyltransferase family 4 protein [Phocaeicola plebeius]|jgi:glycosyltransferase involved in cell wall biosynthesis|uniref:glycosyltransferase family 4 protein n=1 Tax=Phocaeicola plebeius TaxID=310297 RepID=UPI00356662DF